MNLRVGMCGIYFFYFGSVSVRFWKKNSDAVGNEFASVRFGSKNAVRFRYYNFYYLCNNEMLIYSKYDSDSG